MKTKQVNSKKLFWACFIALTATSFIFMFRAMFITKWGVEFGLSETQKGEILGVGLWPFAISIVLFSLIVDRIGYGKVMILAFACHVASTIIILFAKGYWMLYYGTLIMALGNGTVEAVINPIVTSLFPDKKTKWLNRLHAAWPGGMVIGGIMAIALGVNIGWQMKYALVLIPVLLYGILMLPQKFPVSERIKAGVSYLDMLKEVGIIGALIIIFLMVAEIGNVFGFSLALKICLIILITGVFAYYVRSLGQPLFIFLLLIMIPLATTELGTDSWIVDLMTSEMAGIGFNSAWILIYTAVLMTIMRFYAGHAIGKISPLSLLAIGSLIAAIGLSLLSFSTGLMIIIAATIYGIAKSFFWPTMLGIVGERFPKGGALTINLTGGVGMIGVGIIGAVFLGHIQDVNLDKNLAIYDQAHATALHKKYITVPKKSLLGEYHTLDLNKIQQSPKQEIEIITSEQILAKKSALTTVAILPLVMFICYLILIIYFKSKGGYNPIKLLKPQL